MEGIVFLSKRSHFKADPAREEKWLRESQRALERRRQGKTLNRRSAIGKPFGWPLELFSRDLPAGSEKAVPEPDPAKPDKRLKVAPQNDPLSRFREFMNAAPKRPKRPQEDRDKAIMTEDTTVVGDNDARDMAEEEIYERIDEDDVPEQTFSFDYQKVEEEAETRKELAKLRRNSDSYLRDQVFDSCALQGERGFAHELGKFFPWMLDAGLDQPTHIFWHREEVCPQLLDHWTADEFRADKLFVPVDRSNATFMEVIRLWKELDELAAERKRALTAYYCCFSLFYGQKPKQSAHIEHTCLRHDLDKRIVKKVGYDRRGEEAELDRSISNYHYGEHQDIVDEDLKKQKKELKEEAVLVCPKTSYDHAEDFKYENSMNSLKKLLGFVKEEAREFDEVDAYLSAWKRLAGQGRWWFTDMVTGAEWIAVPWLWEHTEPTESTYLKHFDRCFAEEHHSIYASRPKPDSQPDPEAVFEIKASVLARRSAYHHIPGRSFREVAEIIWKVQFKETPDEAKRAHDQAVQDLEALHKESMFAQELPDEILEKKGRLIATCRQYLERSGLVHRVASIVFERQARPRQAGYDLEASQLSKCPKQIWRDIQQTHAQKEAEASQHAVSDKLRREKIKKTPKAAADAREKERLKKAEQRKKKLAPVEGKKSGN